MERKVEKNCINELTRIVALLRDPQKGCQWDKEQTHKSLIPYVIEEAYEVANAIRSGSISSLKEELGDLLLQVILHAQIANEDENFNLDDVITEISQKLIRRHPHVFGEIKACTSEEATKIWSSMKEKENNNTLLKTPVAEKLRRKAHCNSTINGTIEISKKVNDNGLNWDNSNALWAKLFEEINELKVCLEKNDYINAEKELGDTLFTLINVGIYFQINAEEGLAGTNEKIINRFAFLEGKFGDQIINQPRKELLNIWKQDKSTQQ